MLPAARTAAVIEILTEILAHPRPADGTAAAYLRTRRYIGSKDRQAISNRLFRIMREYLRLKWWIERAGLEPDARKFVITALILDNEHSAKSLQEAFSGDAYSPAVLTAEELALAKSAEGQKLEHPDMPLRVRVECPDWAYEKLSAALGDDFETEMRAMIAPAPLDLRVNVIKATREQVLAELREDGFDAHPGKISPYAIRVFGRPSIIQHPVFRGGYVEIQDEGSQMVAVVADAKPGEQVVDFCAGAGGKTLAMAASMNNKGRVIAMDVLDKRLERAKERFRRAGLHNIETRVISSERDRYVKRHQGSFDLVLVDAPCSGTGTWRRDPDKRWQQLGPGLATLVPLQKKILDSAYRMVRHGGRLVYATCSLLPEENEEQMEEFMREHPDFSLKGEYMKLTPAKSDTDGFFAAVLVRKEAPV